MKDKQSTSKRDSIEQWKEKTIKLWEDEVKDPGAKMVKPLTKTKHSDKVINKKNLK